MGNKIQKKGVIITPKFLRPSGGNTFSDIILSILNKHFEIVSVYEIQRFSNMFSKLSGVLCKRVEGITSQIEDDIIEKLKSINGLDFVFVNHSFYGSLVEKIRFHYPKLRIITFYHNIESEFVKGAIKCNKKIGNLLTYKAIFYQEKKLSRYSSLRIVLNNRDAQNLRLNYGIEADYVIPISISDKLDNVDSQQDKTIPSPFALFVGSDFYANYQGIKWFAKNVSNAISMPVYVVGNGFEKYRREFRRYHNINIIGSVDDLSIYYTNAQFVISPIFYGSGMKTKTAEALMYGKSIIGTSEAFEGFLIDESIGRCCNNSVEFVEAINNNHLPKYNANSRLVYEKLYSPAMFEKKLINTICNLLNE